MGIMISGAGGSEAKAWAAARADLRVRVFQPGNQLLPGLPAEILVLRMHAGQGP